MAGGTSCGADCVPNHTSLLCMELLPKCTGRQAGLCVEVGRSLKEGKQPWRCFKTRGGLCCPRPQCRSLGRGRVCNGSRWHCRLRHGPAASPKLGTPGCCSALLSSWGFRCFRLHFRSSVDVTLQCLARQEGLGTEDRSSLPRETSL